MILVRALLVAALLSLTSCAAVAQQSPPAPDAAGVVEAAAATAPPNFDAMPSIRAAFYYPWFPETWRAPNGGVYTNYTPTAGLYDSGTLATLRRHVDELLYANVDVAISSWWGPGTPSAARFETIMGATTTKRIHWSLYYEREGYANPTTDQIVSDLAPLMQAHATDGRLFRLGGRFVVFVYAGASDGCTMATRWVKAAQQLNLYIVLKVFNGYRQCTPQPDGWHQYAPARAADSQLPWSFAVSPGFWLWGEGVRLPRDPAAFRQNVKAMVASGAKLQLISTFNEWGEGTAVEPAQEWVSASGNGVYLDILHEIPAR